MFETHNQKECYWPMVDSLPLWNCDFRKATIQDGLNNALSMNGAIVR